MASERAERLAEIWMALDLGLQAWRTTDARERFVVAQDALNTLAAEVEELAREAEQLRAALRSEARKRFSYTDGSIPDDEWIDAKIAEMYPALAAAGDGQPE